MSTIRQVLMSWIRRARAAIPATFEAEHVYVVYANCPQPSASPGLDVSRDRAYCRRGRKVCPNLQSFNDKIDVTCKAALPGIVESS